MDEIDESRKEDKNGFKAKFMFNIADGGFTGKNQSDFCYSSLIYLMLTDQVSPGVLWSHSSFISTYEI